MPTAPEILPTDDDARGRAARARDRAAAPRTTARASGRTSSARRARRASGRSSACADAPRRAARTASSSAAMSLRIRSHASRICSACAVSTTSDEVRPKCSQRAAGPTFSATAVVKAMTSCCVVCSISSIRATSNARLRPQLARGVGGHEPGLGHRVGSRQFDLQPRLVATLLAPDGAHFRLRVATNHRMLFGECWVVPSPDLFVSAQSPARTAREPPARLARLSTMRYSATSGCPFCSAPLIWWVFGTSSG